MTEAIVTTGEAAAGTIKPAGAPVAPEPVVVKLGDKEFKVAPEVAKELATAQKAASDAGIAKTETERKLAEALRKGEPEKKVVNQDDDLKTIIFTDPDEAIRRIEAKVTAGVEAKLQVGKAQEQFWSSFYDENPGLKDADIVVRAVMGREYESMKPLTLEKAREHLAEATQKELLKLGIKREKGKGKPVAEGGNEPGPKGTKKDAGERPLTGGLSSVLKERAAARREQATTAA